MCPGELSRSKTRPHLTPGPSQPHQPYKALYGPQGPAKRFSTSLSTSACLITTHTFGFACSLGSSKGKLLGNAELLQPAKGMHLARGLTTQEDLFCWNRGLQRGQRANSSGLRGSSAKAATVHPRTSGRGFSTTLPSDPHGGLALACGQIAHACQLHLTLNRTSLPSPQKKTGSRPEKKKIIYLRENTF